MTYRKTWFDYVLWGAYAGLCVIFLAFTGYHIYASYVGLSLAWLGAILVFPVVVCIYLALRLSSQAFFGKRGFSVHGGAMLEAFIVSVSFIFGLIIRITALMYTPPEAVTGIYYERALVRAGQTPEPLTHGVSDLYVRCLSAVFSFLGNGVASAMLFQVFLQIAAMAIGFCAVKKAAGALAGCVSLLFLAFSGIFLGKITVIDPECLFLTLYLSGLLLTLSFLKAMLHGRAGAGGWLWALVVGVLLGVLVYLEFRSATLLLFLTGLFTGKCRGAGERKRCITAFFAACVFSAAGFFAAAAVDCAVSGAGYVSCLSGWASLYGRMDLGGWLLGVGAGHYASWLFLFLAASFLVFAFVRSGKEQDYTLWFLPCILATPVMFSDFGGVGCGSAALFLWSALAGLGVKNCVYGTQSEAVLIKIERINEQVGEPAVSKEETPRFIENPLPLPKKHVKRQMDYDYEVAEEDMHYQVEIPEDDEFDFQ